MRSDFEVERPLEILVGRVERLEVVRAVPRRRAVELRAAAADRRENVGKLRRALEQHVLEQMRHARLAVALVDGADEVRHVDGDRRFRRIAEQQHLQAVVEPVLGDAFDGRHARDAFGQARLSGGDGREAIGRARDRKREPRSGSFMSIPRYCCSANLPCGREFDCAQREFG